VGLTAVGKPDDIGKVGEDIAVHRRSSLKLVIDLQRPTSFAVKNGVNSMRQSRINRAI
jgi:hypothetical protein